MKVLHITASYKPAYIYGGPIYSVAALCEALTNSKSQNTKSASSSSITINVEVITTLANGECFNLYPQRN